MHRVIFKVHKEMIDIPHAELPVESDEPEEIAAWIRLELGNMRPGERIVLECKRAPAIIPPPPHNPSATACSCPRCTGAALEGATYSEVLPL